MLHTSLVSCRASSGGRHLTVGTLTISLHLENAQSLKDKRRLIKSLIDRMRRRFNASVAEVGYLDSWQRAELAVAVVGQEPSHVSSQLQRISSFVELDRSVEVIGIQTELR